MNKSIFPTASSVLTTSFIFLSSACCVGPLIVVFSFIGLSGSTMLAIENVVGPYRSLILSATTILLGVGFYQAYKPLDKCDPGKSCAEPKNRRIQRISLWVATLFLLVLIYFTYIHPNLDVLFGIYL